jgi:3-oxoacyl-[acyl-carrier protein] reductase
MSGNRLEGKKALVTGASGGIGQAIVKHLAAHGVKIIAHGRNKSRLDALVKQHPDIVPMTADFNEPSEVENLANEALNRFGGLDILINNAGIGIHKNVVGLSVSEFDEIMDVNLRAVFILSKIIGQVMVKQGDGYIINIGSGASKTPIAGLATYCASKHALLGFSESLALEMRKHGVKVSILMPGTTATGFGENDAVARLKAKPGILLPEDVAQAVMVLLSQPRRAWTSKMNLRPLDPNKAFDK